MKAKLRNVVGYKERTNQQDKFRHAFCPSKPERSSRHRPCCTFFHAKPAIEHYSLPMDSRNLGKYISSRRRFGPC